MFAKTEYEDIYLEYIKIMPASYYIDKYKKNTVHTSSDNHVFVLLITIVHYHKIMCFLLNVTPLHLYVI